MYKIIALQNDVYYSTTEENGKRIFYANRKGTGYDTRKDVTPDSPVDDKIIEEIYRRPSICFDISAQLQNLINTLEANFRALEA